MLFVPALAFALASCVSGDPTVEPTEEAEEAILPGVQGMPGTFAGTPKMAGDLALLVLKTDGTFHTGKLVYCMIAPCPPFAGEGTYRLYQRDMTSLLVLDRPGHETEIYRYMLSRDTMRLYRFGSGHWQTLHRKVPAWCGVPDDCELQNLPPGPCAGEYRCAEHACNFSCGIPRETAGCVPPPGG
jgi:hypothetical protein